MFSRRPIVLLRADPLLPAAQSALSSDWAAALRSLVESLKDTEIDPGPVQALVSRPPSGETGHLSVGELVGCLASCLTRKAGGPAGEFAAIATSGKEITTFWNDWMEGVGLVAGQHAIRLIELAFADPAGLRSAARAALTEVFATRVDSFIAPMVHAAEARGIPWHSLRRGFPVLAYGQGARQQWFHGTMSGLQSRACVHLTTRKNLSVGLLRAAGLPVPEHELVNSAEQARTAVLRLGFPLVVKPNAGSRAANVSLNLSSEEEVVRAVESCLRRGMRPLVEKQHPGLPYRVTVCNGKAFGALFHAVPFVTGDGETSLRDLIERTNESRQSVVEDDHQLPTPLRTEEFAEEMKQRLREQDITLEDVPAAGRRILLTMTPALGRGGIQVDVTDRMHPDTLALAEEAARVLDAPHLGVDFLITDITRPHAEVPLVINEVNAAPGVRSHIFVAGKPRDLPEELFAPFFPSGDQGRIPIAAAAGETARGCLALLTQLLTSAGETAGYADSLRACVEGYDLRPVEGTAAHPGCALLRDKRPSVAAMGFDFGDIILRGLPSEHLDVVAVARDIFQEELQAQQRQALETLAGMPGKALVLPEGVDADSLCRAAPHRRLILVAEEPGRTGEQVDDTTVVTAYERNGSIWLTARSGARRDPLGRIPIRLYSNETHAWAAALLLGLEKDAPAIARLISTHGDHAEADRTGQA